MLPPVQRTVQLLESLLQAPEGLSLQELLLRVDASRSTLFAMLRTLKALGYAEQSRERGLYRAGPRLLAWRSASPVRRQDVLQAFYHEAARAALPETLALFQAAGGGALLLAQVESPQRVRSVFDPEHLYLPRESASAALLLAPDAEIRARGYALHSPEDSVEVAVPVCSDGVHPDAALALSAPRPRLAQEALETLLPQLRALAARISYRCGALTYAPFQQSKRPVIGPTRPLSPAARDAFLQEPWAARLACLRPDGTPHIVPVWHHWDGAAFYLPAWEGSRWAEYLRANPRLSLSVDESWPPLRRVVAQGRARPLPAAPQEVLRRISRRYLGETRLPRAVATVFRLEPDSLKGWRN